MDKDLSNADTEILVELVRYAQRAGMQGSSGSWKEFLKSHDSKLGDRLSDPARRPTTILLDFIGSFTNESDIKIFSKMLKRCKNHRAIQRRTMNFIENESPQQRLVRLTFEHAKYKQRFCFPSQNEDWILTPLGKISKAMKSDSMIAIDCEMVQCQDGTDAVVQVCAVDHNLEVKLNTLVKPNDTIVDYRTEITGISSKDMNAVTCSLTDVQKSLKKLLMYGTILVGHSLYNDLQALKIDHARVVDTTHIFKYMDPTLHTPSLNTLCKAVLGYEVRKEGHPHDCLEDARAAMKLALAKLEHGFDDPLAIEGTKVLPNPSKLLLHKIPIDVPHKKLLRLFPKNCDVDIQTGKRVCGKTYSTFAVFKNERDADEAFRQAQGIEHKDTFGLPQKLVTISLSRDKTTTFCLRKNAADTTSNVITFLPKKRSADGDEKHSKTKK